MNTSDSSSIIILSLIFLEPDVKNCPSFDLTKLLTTNSSWTFAITVEKFLTSGSKEFTDRILINEEQDIFIWGVVTYVIHSTY